MKQKGCAAGVAVLLHRMDKHELLERWRTGEGRPFKGRLIDWDAYLAEPSNIGCMCAQGQVLHLLGGLAPVALRWLKHTDADAQSAQLLGISIGHSALLRAFNDHQRGCPSDVLETPEAVLGPHAGLVLAFYRHLDNMSQAEKKTVGGAVAVAVGGAVACVAACVAAASYAVAAGVADPDSYADPYAVAYADSYADSYAAHVDASYAVSYAAAAGVAALVAGRRNSPAVSAVNERNLVEFRAASYAASYAAEAGIAALVAGRCAGWEILGHGKLLADGKQLFFLSYFFPNQDPIAALRAVR